MPDAFSDPLEARNPEELRKALDKVESLASLQEFADSPESWRRAEAYLRLGKLHRSKGEFELALRAVDQAEATFLESENQSGVANANLVRAACQLETGHPDLAEELYVRALTVFEERGERRGVAACTFNLGLIAVQRNAFDEAKARFQSAETAFLEVDEPISATVCHMNLANILNQTDRLEEALQVLVESRRRFEELGEPGRAARCQLNASNAFLAAGRPDDALRMFREAHETFAEIGDERMCAACLLNSSQCHIQLNEPDSARPLLVEALAKFEALSDKVGIGECCLALAKLDQNASYAHRSAEAFAQASNRWSQAEAQMVLGKLTNDRAAVEESLALVEGVLSNSINPHQRLTARTQFADLGPIFCDLAPESTSADRRESVLRGTFGQFDDVELVNGEAWLVIAVSDDKTHIFLEKPDEKAIVVVIPEKRDRLIALASEFTQALSHNSEPDDELFELIFAPIWEKLSDCNLLTITAGVHLDGLPFAAIECPDGQFLIEKFAVRQREFRYANQQTTATENLLVARSKFENLPDLPNVTKEASELTDLTEWQVLGESQATPTTVTQKLPDAKRMHIATHAMLHATDPMKSAIVLAEGHLTVAKLLELKLEAELVVLSACESGQGNRSLAWAFLTAGCGEVISACWNAHDEASLQWMGVFYRALLGLDGYGYEGILVAHAVREAHLSLIESGSWTSPHYWALWKLQN